MPAAAASDCLSIDVVLAFVHGQLTHADTETVHVHIALCEDCRALVAQTAKSLLFPSPSAEVGPPHAHPTGPPDPAPAPAPVDRGTKISRYVIERPLGNGATGIVYEANDPQLTRRVALKLLRPDYVAAIADGAANDVAPEARLLREARALAQISHPNVVNVYDAYMHDGRVAIVMELVEGETLGEWLRRSQRSWREIVATLVSAGRGLVATHSVGLIHRDFKPENVLIGADGRVRVSDFGLARPVAVSPPEGSAAPGGMSSDLTAGKGAGTTVAGTPAYMAPELFRGAPADSRTDQFSFCVVLFIALHGRHPFGDAGPNLLNLTRDMAASEVSPATRDEQTLPPLLDAIIMRGLKVDPAERHASVADLVEALSGVLVDSAPLPSIGRGRVTAARALGLVVLGLGLWALLPLSGGDHGAGAVGRCGDARVDPAEECDDGNGLDTDGCRADCRWARCGDGVVRNVVEECDPGTAPGRAGCTDTCLRCGADGASFFRAENGHCYSRHVPPLSWPDAQETCRSAGGDLITYTAGYEVQDVFDALLNGARTLHWTARLDSRDGRLVWENGETIPTRVIDIRWQGPEADPDRKQCPAQLPRLTQGPLVRGGELVWQAIACDTPVPYLCERTGWIIRQRDRHAYRLFHLPHNWRAARDACTRAGGHLATVGDSDEEIFLEATFPGRSWLGATDEGSEKKFVWVTGEPMRFSDWAPREPDHSSGPGAYCLALDVDGLWHDRQCWIPNPFVCEID